MKKICILGGGHGTSRLIKGFKNIDAQIDIILTSSDNGGHTGELIKEFNVPALGDLRMTLESVITDNSIVDFFSYRFQKLHGKENVSLGNLILLSILEKEKNVQSMLKKVNQLAGEKYRFHLSNDEYVQLNAIDKDGNLISGEVNVGECDNIEKLYLDKEGSVDQGVVSAIKEADIIVLSFGSFYTSLGAVLVNKRISEAIKNTKAKVVYIPNLVNQKETKNYVLEDYIGFIEKTIDRKIDRVILSNSKIKRKIVKRYLKENKSIVVGKEKRNYYEYYPLLVLDINKLRHNVEELAKIICE